MAVRCSLSHEHPHCNPFLLFSVVSSHHLKGTGDLPCGTSGSEWCKHYTGAETSGTHSSTQQRQRTVKNGLCPKISSCCWEHTQPAFRASQKCCRVSSPRTICEPLTHGSWWENTGFRGPHCLPDDSVDWSFGCPWW